MADVINTNVFDVNKKFVDFAGLDYFWEKAKTYIDGVDSTMSSKIGNLETTVGDSNSGLVKEVALLRTEMNALGGVDGGDGIGGMIDAKINALNLPNTYDAIGSSAAALVNAKSYADGLNSAIDTRVALLEAINHEEIINAAINDFAEKITDNDKVDTFKELVDYAATNGAQIGTLISDVAKKADKEYVDGLDSAMAARIKTLEDHKDDYVAADVVLETSVKSYADGVAANALTDAKADTDAKLALYAKTDSMTSAIEAAKTAAIEAAKADADAKLADFYNKKAVENLFSENSAADQAYAKAYTDALFNSFVFAGTTDIDGMFA